jgi:hypothetical protein
MLTGRSSPATSRSRKNLVLSATPFWLKRTRPTVARPFSGPPSALSPSLGRSEAWRGVLEDYVGHTVMRAYEAAVRAAAPLERSELEIPQEEWDALHTISWRRAHRALRAKQGSEALPEPSKIEQPVRRLRAFTAQGSWALAMRGDGDATALPATNLELPEPFARDAGVGDICFARFTTPTWLELKVDLLPGQVPRLEAIAANPASRPAPFVAEGREAVARLELLHPFDGASVVVRFSRTA